MDSDWLDDLIALVETDSLTAAAQKRHVTQPAFSRRIQALEACLGSAVIDRSSRPARPTAMISQHIENIRLLSRSLDRLRKDLGRPEMPPQRLVVAAQHSIAIAHMPDWITMLQKAMPAMTVRLHAANRDECFAMLMTGQAMVMFGYEFPVQSLSPLLPGDLNEAMVEKAPLRPERLIPVAAMPTHRSSHISQGRLEIISYPEEVFLGKALHGYILPPLSSRFHVAVVCEAELTSAVLHLARQGAGIAWVPEYMAIPHIEAGLLHDLSNDLGDLQMTVVMLRLKATRPDYVHHAWDYILSGAKLAASV